tara:strand:- start:883 stop:1359 length:477 start_codon:yes stop_codon:yes gene_type:complete
MVEHLELARHLFGLGFSVLPLGENKVPVRKWKRLQTERCTTDDLIEWFGRWKYRPGVVTGELSGIVVVDCDDAIATKTVERAEFSSDTQQRTRRGRHFIYRHPGYRTKNRRNVCGRAIDVRGDGGYIVAYPAAINWTKKQITNCPCYCEWIVENSPSG